MDTVTVVRQTIDDWAGAIITLLTLAGMIVAGVRMVINSAKKDILSAITAVEAAQTEMHKDMDLMEADVEKLSDTAIRHDQRLTHVEADVSDVKGEVRGIVLGLQRNDMLGPIRGHPQPDSD